MFSHIFIVIAQNYFARDQSRTVECFGLKVNNKSMKRKLQRGVTMIELLMYMGLLSILIGVLSTLFVTILETQTESSTTSTVDQDSRYILARMNYDMHHAQQIILPSTPGQSATTLQIRINSVDYTYSLNSGNLQLTVSSQAANLNSSLSTISNVSFQRIGDGDTDDTIRFNFTVTSKRQLPSGPETRSFQTTYGLP